SSAVEKTGVLSRIAEFSMPRKKGSMFWMILKVLPPVSFLSAFLNNTPVVIMFVPIIKKWAEKLNLPPSKFLIPLSYAAIFGGVSTLIGTSTNLVVYGLMLDNGFRGISMFELSKVGIPLAIIGFLYLAVIGHKLLPDTRDPIDVVQDNRKEYLTECCIKENSVINGKNIKSAGLRSLNGVYLMAIIRDNSTIETVNDDEILYVGDRLLFTGATDNIDDIRKISGLSIVGEEEFINDFGRIRQHLVEVVVSQRFPGLGQTVLEYNFRSTYRAVIIAIHRNGERISSKLGDVKLKPGDNLVLLTTKNFINRWKNSQDFYLVSGIETIDPRVNNKKSILTLSVLVLMVIGAAIGSYIPLNTVIKLDMFFFASTAFVILVWFKSINAYNYTRTISWDVLITIASAFGISKALVNSGTADYIAGYIIGLTSSWGPVGVLAGVYLITTIFTEIITNNAAAALMFPIALSTADKMMLNPVPFFIAICIAASASFSTPIGYQTNMIVQGAGGYRFKDYLKVGLPLNLIAMAVALIIIPVFWKF
ncbi:MAG: SLC13 family permease, partial [Spirochaetales bacterium]|nr:SLC13 family permease [Spirochaetales bacterium]